MPNPNKRSGSNNQDPPSPALQRLANQPQPDFELEFFSQLIKKIPDSPDLLRALASAYTHKGMIREGLRVDQVLVELRPEDPTARYNLACRYALLKQLDLAIVTLRKAVELGYRDFRYMIEDRDLDSVRRDPRFRKLLKEFGGTLG
jgi:tetratricopeptide (TPR) repeat protein